MITKKDVALTEGLVQQGVTMLNEFTKDMGAQVTQGAIDALVKPKNLAKVGGAAALAGASLTAGSRLANVGKKRVNEEEEDLQELTPANFDADLMSYGKGFTDSPLQAAKRFVAKHGAAKAGAAALGGVAALGAAAGAGKRAGERMANIGSKRKVSEAEEEHLEEKKGDGRNMNRLGTTLGGMAIGSTLGGLTGIGAGMAGVAASGMTDVDAAANVIRGAGALGNVAGSVAGGVKGWKHATKQNRAMYGKKK